MDDTLGRYEPDNELFRNIVLLVLCFIFALFYTLSKIFRDGYFAWYDWTFIGMAVAAMVLLYQKSHRYLR